MRAPLSVIAAVACAAGVARADDPPAAPAAARWVGTPALPAGRGRVAVVHEFRLSTFFYFADELGSPWSTGLDAAVGLTPRLTVGLSHSARALGTVDRSAGWCHEGGTHRCDAAYAGGLLDARWRALDRGGLTLTALGRAGLVGRAPLRPVVRLGGSARIARGRWWAVLEPEVQISLGHRELGNRDTLVAPLWLGLGHRRAAAWIGSGLRGQLVGFGDKWELPFFLGGAVAVGRVRAGLEAGFPRLIGPQNTGNVRHGVAWIALAW